MYALSIRVDDRDHAMRIGGALQDLIEPAPDALSIFEAKSPDAGWQIDAYYSAPPDADALGREIEGFTGHPVPELVLAPVPVQDWVSLSQAALPPVLAGRFTVYGSHDRGRVAAGPNAILIDAGEAFGTAHHATTFGCLAAIDRLACSRTAARILDLGCGSGVLAIAAARIWPGAAVTAIDIDRGSVAVATENARLNRLGRRMRMVWARDADASASLRGAPFDLVVANILAQPLIALARRLRCVVATGGVLVLSGLLNREAAKVIAAYTAQGFALQRHSRIDGWSTLVLTRRAVAGRRRPA